MSARSISRLARTGVAAGALTVALSVPALAMPARDSNGIPTANASGNITAGTDVASPDQQAPIVASHNVTTGTDVAAPDQQNRVPSTPARPVPQAPTWPENPQPLPPPTAVSTSTETGFQWDDAGIGAGGALAIVLAGLGCTVLVRRRGAHGGAFAA